MGEPLFVHRALCLQQLSVGSSANWTTPTKAVQSLLMWDRNSLRSEEGATAVDTIS